MFCDLVDSTGLGQRLDPEDLRAVLGVFQDTCGRLVEKFEGNVAEYRGDGILTYFSYPQAHEDDAERAVKASLEIVAALEELNPRLERERGAGLHVRVGIHTGRVLVGEVGEMPRREAVALGHTLNVAARLQGIAAPDSVVLSADTLRLVRGLFVTEDLGRFELKGIAEPVAAHRAIRSSGVSSRFDAAATVGLTPRVGREQELAALLDRWHRGREGMGQVVLVSGEAGIGKSRLVRALRDRLAEERHTWLECCCSAHQSNSAFHPVIELLRRALRFNAERPAEEQVAWLERAVDLAGIDRESAVPGIARLLSLPVGGRHASRELSPEAQRRRTLDALAAWLFALAKLQPLVLVVEDLQWADPSSLELLEAVIERVPTAPVLFVATVRSTFEPPWALPPHVARLVVQPLARREAASVAAAVAGSATLPARTLARVVSKTDGIPLFIEELTKSVLESDPSGDPVIPSTLQDSLMARLDRLGAVKEVAQLGSVLGREFSYELLAAVATTSAASLEWCLDQLAKAEVLYPRGEPPDSSYTFKHALIQEAAYQSLLKESRRGWHARVAELLEARLSAGLAIEPEEIARHCEGGGLVERAIAYYQRAGERASERSANAEAIAHLGRGLDLLRSLPEGSARDEREIGLQLALGSAIGSSRGWGTAEAAQAYDRARPLCERIGETPQLFPVLRGLTAFYTSRAELDTALDLGSRLLRLAESRGDSSQLLLANHHVGIVHFFRGDPCAALEHLRRAVAQYRPSEHRRLASLYQAEPGVMVRAWMAWPLWLAGLPDQALAMGYEAIALAREASHPFSLAQALAWTSVVHVWRRDREAVRRLAGEAIAIAQEQQFAVILAAARIHRALSGMDPQADERRIEAAIGDFRQALTELGTTASGSATRPWVFGELAAALASVGRDEAARSAVDAGLADSAGSSQAFYDAELNRIKGELLRKDPSTRGEAERHFRLALELSRKQRARMLELRAALSLARLLRERGERGEARALLVPIHASFSEGFDTPELIEARALLEAS
jgi:class 3 adenylate cyclase/predicted ATPase